MAALTQDQDQISAFVSWTNFTGMIFYIGLGLANVSRINISNYVGERKYTQAKHLQNFYIFLVSIIGTIVFVLVLTFRHSISTIYSGLPGVTNWLDRIFLIYSIGAFLEICMGTLCTMLRVANRTGHVIIIVVSTFVSQLTIQSFIFFLLFDMGVVGLALSFVLSSLTCNSIYAYIIFKYIDWSEVKLHAE